MQYIMDNVNLFFTKKCILTTKGTETEHTAEHPTNNAMKSNFEKLCKWLNEQTKLFTVSELHAKNMFICKNYLNVYCLKWMKKQKMDEKAVRTALPKFFFLN